MIKIKSSENRKDEVVTATEWYRKIDTETGYPDNDSPHVSGKFLEKLVCDNLNSGKDLEGNRTYFPATFCVVQNKGGKLITNQCSYPITENSVFEENFKTFTAMFPDAWKEFISYRGYISTYGQRIKSRFTQELDTAEKNKMKANTAAVHEAATKIK